MCRLSVTLSIRRWRSNLALKPRLERSSARYRLRIKSKSMLWFTSKPKMPREEWISRLLVASVIWCWIWPKSASWFSKDRPERSFQKLSGVSFLAYLLKERKCLSETLKRRLLPQRKPAKMRMPMHLTLIQRKTSSRSWTSTQRNLHWLTFTSSSRTQVSSTLTNSSQKCSNSGLKSFKLTSSWLLSIWAKSSLTTT